MRRPPDAGPPKNARTRRVAPRAATATPALAPAPRAGWALWGGLVAVTALRLVLPFVPGTWGWGLDVLRGPAPPLALLCAALGAAACVPAIAAGATRALERLAARVPAGALPGALAAAALVWLLPDRAWFIGDHILRAGAVGGGATFTYVFPESLPLDVLLHGRLPALVSGALPIAPETFGRVLGAAEAALMAWLAARFTRAQGLRGATALAVGAGVLLGGWLTVFTGFGKSASELCLVALALGTCGRPRPGNGRELLLPALAVAVSLTLHRSAILFLPALAVLWLQWWRAQARPGAWHAPAALAAAALPLATLAVMAGRIVTILRTFDLPQHVASTQVSAGGGPLATAFAPLHVLDLANLLVALAPLAALLPVLPLPRAHRRLAASPGLPLLVLALSFAPALLFAHPKQGLFRDWDVFAPAGVALAMVVAWRLSAALAARPGRAWLAAPLLAAALLPTLCWLALEHDVDRGIARARRFAESPPARGDVLRAHTWDYVGLREFKRARWAAAADAFRRSHAAEPQARVLRQWALAATLAGDYVGAEGAYGQLVRQAPGSPTAWLGLAGVAMRVGDSTTTRSALTHLEAWSNDPQAQAAMSAFVRAFPAVWPAPAGGANTR